MNLFTKKKKKGFTIVELVIVIAVIGVLAAILIPTFVGLVNRANVAADGTLVRELNNAIALDLAEKGETKHETMTDALEATKEYGFDVSRISTKASKNKILWDSVHGVFCYLQEDATKVEYVPGSVKIGDELSAGDYRLWIISSTVDGTYSTYLYGYNGNGTVDAKYGLDVGNETNVTTVNYTNESGNVQNVVIRTNNYNTVLTVNAPSDVVKHYGKANKVDVIAVAGSSYHEHGDVLGNITLNNGRVVVEEGAKANAVYVEATAEAITAGTVTVSADNSKEPEVPIILRDYVKEAADNKGGNNSIPNPATENVIVLSDKVTETNPETGEVTKTEVTAIAYNKTTKQNYASLAEAVAEANSGDTIIMMNNETTSQQQIQINKSLTIDGNGYTLTNSNPNPRLLYITNFAAGLSNVEVTIKNINLYSSYTGKTTKDTAEPRGITTHTVSNSTINISNVKVEMAQNDYTFPVKMVKTTNCTININNSFLKGANCIEWINVNGSTLNIKDTTLYSNYNKEIPTHYGHGILVDDDCENNVVNCDNCLFMSDGNSVHYYAGKFNTVNGELVEYKEPVACDVTIMIGSVELKHLETVADLVKTYINNGWDESYKIDLRLNADLFLSQNEYDIIVPASNINYNGFKIINN